MEDKKAPKLPIHTARTGNPNHVRESIYLPPNVVRRRAVGLDFITADSPNGISIVRSGSVLRPVPANGVSVEQGLRPWGNRNEGDGLRNIGIQMPGPLK